MKKFTYFLNSKKGFILLYAVLIMSIILALTFSITDLTIKERKLSRFGEESSSAFFAAESGMECALYWDLKDDESWFRYDPSAGRSITCNGQTFPVGNDINGVTEIKLVFSDSSNSSTIVVDKSDTSSTVLLVSGYSVPDSSVKNGVERGIKVSYGDTVESGGEMCMFDILFVIDNSGSIELFEKGNMKKLTDAAIVVVDNFDDDDVGEDGAKFSAVGFETTAFIQERLSESKDDVKSAINIMDSLGGTNTSGGLLLAEYELNSDNDRDNADNIIILMTDGDGSACIGGDIYEAGFAPFLGKYVVDGIDWCGAKPGTKKVLMNSENETRPIVSRLKSDNNVYLIVIAIKGKDHGGKELFNEAFMTEIADKYYLVEGFKDIDDVTKLFDCDYFNRFINGVKREEF